MPIDVKQLKHAGVPNDYVPVVSSGAVAWSFPTSAAGWFDSGTAVQLITSTDQVGIGVSPGAGNKLEVLGDAGAPSSSVTAGPGGDIWLYNDPAAGGFIRLFSTGVTQVQTGTNPATGIGSYLNVQTGAATSGNQTGGDFFATLGAGIGTGRGGSYSFQAGSGGANGPGGITDWRGGVGGSTSGNGGPIDFRGGEASATGNGGPAFWRGGTGRGVDGDGGAVYINSGEALGTGVRGSIVFDSGIFTVLEWARFNETGQFGIGTPTPTAGVNVEINASTGGFTTGLRVINGFVSCPDGTSSERFGAGAIAAGPSAVAVGNGATVPLDSGASIAIGYNALTGGSPYYEMTAIGYSAQTLQQTSVSLGAWAAANSNRGTALGAYATINAPLGLALGASARVFNYGSAAIGPFSQTDAANQLVFGDSLFCPYNDIVFGSGSRTLVPANAEYTIRGCTGIYSPGVSDPATPLVATPVSDTLGTLSPGNYDVAFCYVVVDDINEFVGFSTIGASTTTVTIVTLGDRIDIGAETMPSVPAGWQCFARLFVSDSAGPGPLLVYDFGWSGAATSVYGVGFGPSPPGVNDSAKDGQGYAIELRGGNSDSGGGTGLGGNLRLRGGSARTGYAGGSLVLSTKRTASAWGTWTTALTIDGGTGNSVFNAHETFSTDAAFDIGTQSSRARKLYTAGLGLSRVTASSASPPTLTATDQYVSITTNTTPFTITMPVAATVGAGHVVWVNDAIGSVGANNVTIAGQGGDTVKGGSILLDINYAAVMLVSDGVSNWEVN